MTSKTGRVRGASVPMVSSDASSSSSPLVGEEVAEDSSSKRERVERAGGVKSLRVER